MTCMLISIYDNFGMCQCIKTLACLIMLIIQYAASGWLTGSHSYLTQAKPVFLFPEGWVILTDDQYLYMKATPDARKISQRSDGVKSRYLYQKIVIHFVALSSPIPVVSICSDCHIGHVDKLTKFRTSHDEKGCWCFAHWFTIELLCVTILLTQHNCPVATH